MVAADTSSVNFPKSEQLILKIEDMKIKSLNCYHVVEAVDAQLDNLSTFLSLMDALGTTIDQSINQVQALQKINKVVEFLSRFTHPGIKAFVKAFSRILRGVLNLLNRLNVRVVTSRYVAFKKSQKGQLITVSSPVKDFLTARLASIVDYQLENLLVLQFQLMQEHLVEWLDELKIIVELNMHIAQDSDNVCVNEVETWSENISSDLIPLDTLLTACGSATVPDAARLRVTEIILVTIIQALQTESVDLSRAINDLDHAYDVVTCCTNGIYQIVAALDLVSDKISQSIDLAFCKEFGGAEYILNFIFNKIEEEVAEHVFNNEALQEFIDLRIVFPFPIGINDPIDYELDAETCIIEDLPVNYEEAGLGTDDFYDNLLALIDAGTDDQVTSVSQFVDEFQTAMDESCLDAHDALFDFDGYDWNGQCCDQARTCDVQHKIVLYEDKYCGGNIAGTFSDTTQSQDFTKKLCIANDEAQSLRILPGVQRGLRIYLGDNPNAIYLDDSAVITTLTDITGEDGICVNFFERQYVSHTHALSYSPYNGLGGKVSRIVIQKFDDKDLREWLIRAARNVIWVPWFSEENQFSSNLFMYHPMTGLWCDDNDCDDKSVLQASYSECKGAVRGWADYFTSDAKFRDCGAPDEYIGRIKCRGSKCREMAIRCVQVNINKCQIESSGSVRRYVREGRSAQCPDFQVITGLKCFGSYCNEVEFRCRTLTLL